VHDDVEWHLKVGIMAATYSGLREGGPAHKFGCAMTLHRFNSVSCASVGPLNPAIRLPMAINLNHGSGHCWVEATTRAVLLITSAALPLT
jgi:hypothetical protein